MKAWMNYWVDMATGLAFILAAVSGVILWPPLGLVTSRDYVLGVHIFTWDALHSWSGLTMTAGVFTHLVLHWRWLVGMTRRAMHQQMSGRCADRLRPMEASTER